MPFQRSKQPYPVVKFVDEEPSYYDFGIRQMTRFHSALAQKREYYSILLFLTGGCTVLAGGRETMVTRGSIFFLQPYLPHQVKCTRENVRAYFIYFKGPFVIIFPPGEIPALDIESFHHIPLAAPFVLQNEMTFELRGKELAQVLKRCKRMEHELHHPHATTEETIRLNVKELLLQVTTLYESEIQACLKTRRRLSPLNESVARILSFLNRNLREKITLTNVAREVALSPNYVSHLIKRETGKNLKELINERRMDRAKHLLRLTALRLDEIAEQTGYADPAYFSRLFKSHTGQSPRGFRESTRKHK
jgi:AraC-like DNA-binding protein